MKIACVFLLACLAQLVQAADIPEEFRIKPEQEFGFEKKPAITRDGDAVTVAFTTTAFCDVTVAVEDAEGRILRHLASGVLGNNAPKPFQKSSKSQELVWDGKDDLGAYVDDKDALTVRVSLGLKAQYERDLYRSTKRPFSGHCPLMRAAPEGVYVYYGHLLDSVVLYDHDGSYKKTVYPFSSASVEKVQGLHWGTFPQDGKRLPLKEGFRQSTFLTSGNAAGFSERFGFGAEDFVDFNGRSAYTMAVRDGRIALADHRVNRLAADGTSGGLPLGGPATSLKIKARGGDMDVAPWGAAFSPDGKWLYLSGYGYRYWGRWDCFHVVYRVRYDLDDAKMEVFAGDPGQDAAGTDNAHFACAADVACDNEGRVYVADYMNDRIQVYDPAGKFLKTIPSDRPAKLTIDPKSGESWVFSWSVHNSLGAHKLGLWKHRETVNPTLTHLGPMDNPKPRASYPLPFNPMGDRGSHDSGSLFDGPAFLGDVDVFTEPPVVWVGRIHGRLASPHILSTSMAAREAGAEGMLGASPWATSGIRLLKIDGGELKLARSFGEEVERDLKSGRPPEFFRQRLFVNPKDGRLYLAEGDSGIKTKGFAKIVEIDAVTGKTARHELPFTAEDMGFDLHGHAYLRGWAEIVRYDPSTWREVPFDYGEERKGIRFGSSSGDKPAPAIGALALPNHITMWQRPGFWVSPKGHVAVGCLSYPASMWAKGGEASAEGADDLKRASALPSGTAWRPQAFPGRYASKHAATITIWDKHGQLLKDDVLPGLHACHGVAMDANGDVYVMTETNRVMDGTAYFNDAAMTLIKFTPGGAKIVSDSPSLAVPLPKADVPERAPDLGIPGQRFWGVGLQWYYGGVGYGGAFGHAAAIASEPCSCWNSRFYLDLFGRSFAPSFDHYSVAVLDTAGNLVLRVGTYGNADDGVALDPNGDSPCARSIGGDEVSLYHPCYVATDTDRRLFVADAGNSRIVGVKLGYHAEEKIALKDIQDRAQAGE